MIIWQKPSTPVDGFFINLALWFNNEL